ncbi:MAG: TldD/PmbA family protein [Chloroflexota bacterium]
MVGKERALALLERALNASPAEQTEVSLRGGESNLTRYANNAIHQNVSDSNYRLAVRLAFGKRLGIASTNDLSDEGIRRCVDEAVTIARLSQENPDFVSFAKPAAACGEVITSYASTAGCTPEDRAQAVRRILARADAAGLEAAGACETVSGEFAVANSHGVCAYAPYTDASITAVIMSDTGSGYADAANRDFAALAVDRVASESVERAQAARNPRAVEPGEYEVVLNYYAVQELLHYLNYMAFGAMAYQEGRSFMAGRLGEKVMSEKISIWDDGLDAAGPAMPFDGEGVPKQRVDLIKDGVATGVVYDTFTANREPGRVSTGHGTGYSAHAGNLFIGAGDATPEQMIAATKRAIFVTRFHYIRAVHPGRTIVTGMTRDGAFLIEDGKIVGPVKNLRFTQSIVDAFAGAELVGRDRQRVFASVVPMLKLARFNFTGGTDH